MPRAVQRNGRTEIGLYEAEKNTLKKAADILGFIGKVADCEKTAGAAKALVSLIGAITLTEQEPAAT